MRQPVLLAGLFIGVLSGLPIVSFANFCCCLWVVAGGVLAAYWEQQTLPVPISPGRGALVGVQAGLVGAVVWLIVAAVFAAVLAPLQQAVIESLRDSPELPPAYRRLMELVAREGSATLSLAVGFILHACASAFAALGGLLGAALFKRNAIGPDAGVPPPLPPV
jgi:hypothetical protein